MEHQISTMLNVARKAFKQGKSKPIEFRIKQLNALDRMLSENESLFVDALAKDLKKPRQEAILLELAYLHNEITITLSNIKNWTSKQKVSKTLVTLMDEPYIKKEPYGVVLVLGAWNYPVQLLLAPIIGAIAAGNCVIAKPSEVAPSTADLMKELMPRYLDQECYHVFLGGPEETTLLLKEKFDYIFYTGSTNIGKIVYKAAHENLTPVTLELGGKSPAFVDHNLSSLDVPVRRLLWGKMINSGQTCVAPDYILCTAETKDKLIPVFKKIFNEYFGPDPKKSPDFGRIINSRHVERIKKCMEGSGKIVIGGEVDKDDCYVSPTVITDVKVNDPIMQEEIFGPVLPIITVRNPEEAIDLINDREKPLTLYVFSEDSKTINKFVDNTTSGSICVNDAVLHLAVSELPFGGVGKSGMGSYHGEFSFDTFSHKKSVLVRNYNPIVESLGNSRYPPYSDKKIKFLSKMLKPGPNIPAILTSKLGYFIFGASSVLVTLTLFNKALSRTH